MKKPGLFFLLFLLGMFVYFVGGYWAGLATIGRSITKTMLPFIFLLLTLAAKRFERLRAWQGVFLALLAASFGFLVSWWLAKPLLAVLGISPKTASGLALAKLVDSVLIVLPVLIVMKLGGVKPAELFLRKGKLFIWLLIGLISFFIFFLLFLLQSRQQGLSASQLLNWAPWILVFISANAFMEELHFRGLLLRPYENLLGKVGANFCIALFFTLVHAPVTYTANIGQFLVILFILALAWGYIIQKTESLWGTVLVHAGADLLVIVSILQSFNR